MRRIPTKEIQNHLAEALNIAQKSTCKRAKCGSVIIKDNRIIGKGYNSPPADLESQRRCACEKDELHPKITDKTCCVHAEQRAIIDALQNNAEKIKGSTLIFVRLNEQDTLEPAGNPYCTQCSKSALDVGIAEFILIHKEGPTAYSTEEYNILSYQYKT
ncbi:MAG: hypothetical protein AABY02_04710 [Nanoarchaeota archaeon]